MTTASTSYASTTESEDARPKIKVPKNSRENRELKKGHLEDNNEDISYVHVKLLWPALIFTILSGTCMIVGVLVSLKTDFVPSSRQLKRGFVVRYGSSLFRCNMSIPFPPNPHISVLNLFEMNVVGNVLFRLAACLPMAVRIFNAFAARCILRVENADAYSFLYRICNEIGPILTTVEVFSMALFSIITVHSDFPETNRYCKVVFSFSAALNMLLTTVLMFSYGRKSEEKADTLSVGLKLVTSAVFCYLTPQYFQTQNAFISFPICHSYVSRTVAFMEYGILAAYAVFQMTSLLDIRDVTLMCYPRTCSGECEPVDPRNFEKGAKYEYCRAFELNQRRMLSL